MRVLSIDLDYCMDSCMDMIDNQATNAWNDENPVTRWKSFEEFSAIPDQSIFIDHDKVDYCFDIYTKALKNCNNVIFAYDHDAILYRLEMDDAHDLEIINIDYHNDILNGTPYCEYTHLFDDDMGNTLEYEYQTFQHGRVMEGNWVGWLFYKEKLKHYTWIHGVRSLGSGKSCKLYEELLEDKFDHCLKENYKFDNFKFDFIFVCLSPNYIPQKFWNIFTKYLSEYEKVTGKSYKLINRKYEIDTRYNELHKYTLPSKR